MTSTSLTTTATGLLANAYPSRKVCCDNDNRGLHYRFLVLVLEQGFHLLFDWFGFHAYLVGVFPVLFHDFEVAGCSDIHPTRNEVHCSRGISVNGNITEGASEHFVV